MSGPVDLLAYHDALIAAHRALSADAYHAQELPKAEAALAAVAELIEAAKGATEEKMHDGASSKAACDRLAAALARVGGAK